VTSVPNTLPHLLPSSARRARRRVGVAATSLVAVSTFGLLAGLTGTAQAAPTPVGLGTATSFAVLAGTGITNTGSTVITGDIGTSPTPSSPGAENGISLTGTNHSNDAVTLGAKSALVTAYDAAAGEGPRNSVSNLRGGTLTAGVYNSGSSLLLSGDVTLNAQGDPDAVFVFQVASDLTTATSSRVLLANGAQACNVYWQVGSSATLGTGTQFVGNILALTSITLVTNATVQGRVLARNGTVTFDTNTITVPSCTTPVDHSADNSSPSPSPSPSPSSAAPTAASAATSASGSAGTTRRPTYGQVRRVPVGAVDTGDGSMAVEPHRSSAR
jgi:hypothetical protein